MNGDEFWIQHTGLIFTGVWRQLLNSTYIIQCTGRDLWRFNSEIVLPFIESHRNPLTHKCVFCCSFYSMICLFFLPLRIWETQNKCWRSMLKVYCPCLFFIHSIYPVSMHQGRWRETQTTFKWGLGTNRRRIWVCSHIYLALTTRDLVTKGGC